MGLEYVKHRRILLKTNPDFNEAWLQQRISEDPALLGLGDLDVKDEQRTQPRRGRLDMLLSDAETQTRYEVEIQLGATDETHIVRTIEYWDIERQRYPQYDHVGVIVAEEITARFFNVISLFNRSIPLIAVQLNAIAIEDNITLVFTKVLDHVPLGTEEEDEPEEPRDRNYWESKSSPEMLTLADDILEEVIRPVEPGVVLKYNKYYIGLARDGIATNFVTLTPRKKKVMFEFKLERSEEVSQRLDEAGIELLAYSRWGTYRVQVTRPDIAEHGDLLRELTEKARDQYRS
jgi:hypothetical protein